MTGNRSARRRTRQHLKTRQNATQPQQSPSQNNHGLPQATLRLIAAVAALTNHQPPPPGQHGHAPSRYTDLRNALHGHRVGHTHTQPSSLLPFWIDPMKLILTIDDHTQHLTNQYPPLHCTLADRHEHPTVRRLRALADRQWNQHQTNEIETIAANIEAWACAIDDLFAPAPAYLPDPCPQCDKTHTYRLNDEGQRVRVAALSVTADQRGATCNNCHAKWEPLFLGRILGYQQPDGILA